MMQNYRLSVDIQFDSIETAKNFAKVLSKTVELTAKTTIDICEHETARVILGVTTLVTAKTFKPN